MNDPFINDLIATKVMDWYEEEFEGFANTVIYRDKIYGLSQCDKSEWQPSCNIAQAWKALEKFPVPRYWVRIVATDTGNWRCDIDTHGGDGPKVSAFDESAAKAISMACLKAIGVAIE